MPAFHSCFLRLRLDDSFLQERCRAKWSKGWDGWIEIFRLMSDSFGSRGLSSIRCPSANPFVLLGHFNPSRTDSTWMSFDRKIAAMLQWGNTKQDNDVTEGVRQCVMAVVGFKSHCSRPSDLLSNFSIGFSQHLGRDWTPKACACFNTGGVEHWMHWSALSNVALLKELSWMNRQIVNQFL